jgi:hypothetical protein
MAMPPAAGSELDRALAALELLPFVGLVEAFGASAERLQRAVQPLFPEFRSFEAWENQTNRGERSLDQRLESIRAELGDACFEMLMETNKADMELYRRLRAAYAMSSDAAGPSTVPA